MTEVCIESSYSAKTQCKSNVYKLIANVAPATSVIVTSVGHRRQKFTLLVAFVAQIRRLGCLTAGPEKIINCIHDAQDERGRLANLYNVQCYKFYDRSALISLVDATINCVT